MWNRLAQAFSSADTAAVVATLADDVVLRVAVHAQPFDGRPAANQIFSTVLDGVLTDIEVVETIEGGETAVVMFRANVTGYAGRADGLLVARRVGGGPIADLTVFVRPLAALQALADEMGRRLGGPRPD